MTKKSVTYSLNAALVELARCIDRIINSAMRPSQGVVSHDC